MITFVFVVSKIYTYMHTLLHYIYTLYTYLKCLILQLKVMQKFSKNPLRFTLSGSLPSYWLKLNVQIIKRMQFIKLLSIYRIIDFSDYRFIG